MKTTARDLATMPPAQAAYALALAAFEASHLRAETLKIERGVDYTKADTEEALDAMCEIETEIDGLTYERGRDDERARGGPHRALRADLQRYR